MASDAARGSTAMTARNYPEAIQHYTKALESSQSPVWLIERSIAYQRMKQYERSLVDAENAYHAATLRAKRELKATAQLRRAIALHSLGRLGDARRCLVWARELNEKEKSLGMWQARVTQDYENLPEDDEGRKVIVKLVPDKHDENDFSNVAPPIPVSAPKAGSDTLAPSHDTSATVAQKTLLPQNIRYDWYQSTAKVHVTIPYKGLTKEMVSYDISKHHVSRRETCANISIKANKLLQLDVSFPTTAGSDYILDLDLASAVEPSKSTITVSKFKVELSLHKMQEGVKWAKIEGEPVQEGIDTKTGASSLEHDGTENKDSKLTTSTLPAYPSSAKNKVNWDKLDVEEDEGEQGADDFFKKLFKDADPDTKRAMMKSMSESGGTTLSTDWKDVGSRYVEPHPPGGTETS